MTKCQMVIFSVTNNAARAKSTDGEPINVNVSKYSPAFAQGTKTSVVKDCGARAHAAPPKQTVFS